MKPITLLFVLLLAGCDSPQGLRHDDPLSSHSEAIKVSGFTRYNNVVISCEHGGEYRGTIITDGPLDTEALCKSVARLQQCAMIHYSNGTVWGSCEPDAVEKLAKRIVGMNAWCESTFEGMVCHVTD